MNIIAIIPARMASSRFPGKPMAKILGIPMIGHVYLRTRMCPILSETYVATCDEVIRDYIISIGGKCVMTSSSHERCTDRTVEALGKIEAEEKIQPEVVVMVQGDEPLLVPEMVEAALTPFLEDSSVQVVNLMAPLKSKQEHEDPNEVKVVVDRNNFALYFSREPIPSRKKRAEEVPIWKQVCIIPFRREFLLQFSSLSPTPLEKAESVDMLRVLEHGMKVKMVPVDFETYSVDTKEDRERVEELMKRDPLFSKYRDRKRM